MRVLLVEDDPMIGRAVQAALKDAGYAADWVKTGPAALAALAANPYELALLDLGLPGADGMQVLRQLRARHAALPAIVITARDGLDARIQGLDAGADDYLPKPFAISELLARMRAVLRRQGGSAQPLLQSAHLTLDPATHQASAHGQPPVQLSKREFAVLHALMARPGAIVSRAELEERVYGWGEEVESNAIDFLIHGLRKKLGSQAIKNIRGAGWTVARAA